MIATVAALGVLLTALAETPATAVVRIPRRPLRPERKPGDEQEIASFCKRTHDVSFPFAKIQVNGVDAHLLCRLLKTQVSGLLGT